MRYLDGLLAAALCFTVYSSSVDRKAVIHRHSPNIVDPTDVGGSVAVGNGFFATHTGCTGSQSANQTLNQYFGVQTMSEWAFHAIPYESSGRPLDSANSWEDDVDSYTGKVIPSFTNLTGSEHSWVYTNPVRYDLGQFAVAVVHVGQDGSFSGSSSSPDSPTAPIQSQDIVGCRSSLDLWSGVQHSLYNASAGSDDGRVLGSDGQVAGGGFMVEAWTAVHPDGDIVSHRMQVQGPAPAGDAAPAAVPVLVPRLAFAYPTGQPSARDWTPGTGKNHETRVMANESTGGFATVLLQRTIDNSTSYRVRCNATWPAGTVGAGGGGCSAWQWARDPRLDHTLLLVPAGCAGAVFPHARSHGSSRFAEGYGVSVSCGFAPVDRRSGRVEYLAYPPVLRDAEVVRARQSVMSRVMGEGESSSSSVVSLGSELPSAMAVEAASASAWSSFWSSGAAVDLQSGLTESAGGDGAAHELERRVVLSQYASRALETGAFPPCESGLVRNSGWNGKSHLEMRWFHQGHQPAWGRAHLIRDRSDLWYHAIMRNASSYARYQGYNGSSIPHTDVLPGTATRWPKQVGLIGPTGDENDPFNGVAWAGIPVPGWVDQSTGLVEITAPNHIGPRLIWQQPHVFWYAEQERLACMGNATCEADVCQWWKEPLLQTASFLVQLLVSRGDGMHLDPPLIGGEEQGNNFSRTVDPTFELAYVRWALDLTQDWLQDDGKWGMGASEAITRAQGRLAALPVGRLGRTSADVQQELDGWMTAVAPTAARGVRERLLTSMRSTPGGVWSGGTQDKQVYTFNAACNCTFQLHKAAGDSCPPSTSHPLFVGAFGVFAGRQGAPGSAGAGLDVDLMNDTVAATAALWDWNCTRGDVWGWDAAWLAQSMARLGWHPEAVAEMLLLPAKHNGFAAYNGYNTGGEGALAAYLPGNGGLLHTVALLANQGGSGGLPWGGVGEGFPPYVSTARAKVTSAGRE